MEHNPTRSESSLRRGVLHNACEQDDGSWSWRWDPMRDWKTGEGSKENAEKAPDFGALWDRVSSLACPVHLWLGGAWSVVGDEDVDEFRGRQPDVSITTVEGAGHSIQGDRPLELVALIEGLLAEPA